MENTRFYISRIKFNTGNEIQLNDFDIILFVGGNNVGKSCSLKEIFDFVRDGKKGNQKIIDDIDVVGLNFENFKETVLNNSTHFFENGRYVYRGLGFSLSDYSLGKFEKGHSWSPCNFFSCQLNTKNRLAITEPTENLNTNENPTNLLQHLAKYPNDLERLNNEFYKTFGFYLICDTCTSRQIVLRLTKEVKQIHSDSINAMRELQNIFLPLPKVEEQGDGIKSYIAILTNIIIKRYSMYFIDEPESFLHQPQAFSIAQSIASLGRNKQLFISTHSTQILLGLLSICPERLKIIKLTRHSDSSGKETNPFTLLDNEHISEIINDPLMQYSNIFDGIFYKKAVIVESESDCKFYELIYKTLNNKNEYFFTLSHGKGKMPKIIASLEKLGVDSTIVFDIDIFDNPEIINSILSVKSGDFKLIENDFLDIRKYVYSIKETDKSKLDVFQLVESEINSNAEDFLTEETRKKVQKNF